jgi:hypothetical protein
MTWNRNRGNPRAARGDRPRQTLSEKKYPALVKVLDREFSLYVRMSGAGSTGFVRCATCGQIFAWRDITLGHYISRSHHAVRWDLHNCAPQCRRCNCYRGGEQHRMRQYLVNRYGAGEVEAAEMRAQMSRAENADSLREKIAFYRGENKRLKSVLE